MSQRKALAGIWMGGFLFGFISYLTYPVLRSILLRFIPYLLTLESTYLGAMIAGLVTSLISLVLVYTWAYSSKPRY